MYKHFAYFSYGKLMFPDRKAFLSLPNFAQYNKFIF